MSMYSNSFKEMWAAIVCIAKEPLVGYTSATQKFLRGLLTDDPTNNVDQ